MIFAVEYVEISLIVSSQLLVFHIYRYTVTVAMYICRLYVYKYVCV